MIEKLAKKIISGSFISRKEASYLINLSNDYTELFYYANKIRERYKGKKIKFCSIVNAKSGLCSENCKFCAQSIYYNTGVEVYQLKSIEEIINVASKVFGLKASGFGLVTSGVEVNISEINIMCEVIKSINQMSMYTCASLGKLDYDKARKLKESGLKRYHHNLETSRRFFKEICSTHSYNEKIETIKIAKDSGLEICCGGIFGMGETNEDIIDFAFTLRKLEPDSIPLNFLNPRPGTPLEDKEKLLPMEALKIIAIFRFIFPDKDITVCGGREVVLRDLQSWMFYAGANGTMIGNYLTTSGRPPELDGQMVKDLGLNYE
ncbi:MAG: biotin synthase BioB [Candidatus Firestonebacteria bacterium]